MATQTLKSALTARVSTGIAERMGSSRLYGGHGENCRSGAGELNFDPYGRPSTMNTLSVGLKDAGTADCSRHTISAEDHIARETLERPYITVTAAGFRGGDGMGRGRNLFPRSMYGHNDYRGNFVRSSDNPSNALPSEECKNCKPAPQHHMSAYTGSMDATHRSYY